MALTAEDQNTEFVYASRTRTDAEMMAELQAADPDMEYTAEVHEYATPEAEENPPAEPAKAAEPPAAAPPASETKIPVPPVEPAQPATAAASETPAAASEPAATQETEEDKHKRLGGWQRKIKAKDAEIGRLQKELEDLRKAPVAQPAQAEPTKIPEPVAAAPAVAAPEAVNDPEPDPESYPEGVLDRKFVQDTARWIQREDKRQEDHAKQEREKAESVRKLETDAHQAKQHLAADEAALESRWQAQLAEARKAHPDLDEVFNKTHPEVVDGDGKPRAIANGVMWNAMKRNPDGAEIGHWLATHPEDSAEIAELTTLTPESSQQEVFEAYQTVAEEFGLIRKELGKSRRAARKAADPPADPPQEEVKPPAPAAAPVKAAAPAPETAAPPPAIPPRPPKKAVPEPIVPIGSRGSGGYKTLKQLMATKEGQRIYADMPDDEMRRRLAQGEGSEE